MPEPIVDKMTDAAKEQGVEMDKLNILKKHGFNESMLCGSKDIGLSLRAVADLFFTYGPTFLTHLNVILARRAG